MLHLSLLRNFWEPFLNTIQATILFSQPKHILWVLNGTVSTVFLSTQKYQSKLMGKKTFTISHSKVLFIYTYEIAEFIGKYKR